MTGTSLDFDPIPKSETMTDLSGHEKKVRGVCQPTSRQEVLAAIQAAKIKGLRIHPFSCGNNWGFGSRLPVQDDALLLDLSHLKAIRTLNLEQDFVELEPGVSQGDLDQALQRAGGTHYFNVTGAGQRTSVLGNALERGIGYFGSRKDDLLDLEVVLGHGEIIWSKGVDRNPHHPGLGPDLTGTFLQSHWGIVIGARVRLLKRPPYMGALLLQLKGADRFPAYFEAIANACREGLFRSVPHIANRERMISTFGPYLPPARLRDFAQSAPEWSCLVPVGGTKATVHALFEHMVGCTKDFAACRLVDSEVCRAEPHLEPAFQLALGRPNDFALPGVAFSALGTVPSEVGDLDGGLAGLIHVTPSCTNEASALQELLGLIENTRFESGMQALPMTLNLVNPGTVAVIISVPFDRGTPGSFERSRYFADLLQTRCCDFGFLPYRLGLEDAEFLPRMSPPRSRLLRELENVMDSSSVLAPSRYSPLVAGRGPEPFRCPAGRTGGGAPMKNVVITDYSIVAPKAQDVDSFWNLIEQGISPINRISRFDASPTGCSIGGEVEPFPLDFLPAGMKPKRMARHTILLTKAALGLVPNLPATGKFGLCLGVATSDSAMIAQSGFQRALKGAGSANPHCVNQTPPHAAVGMVGRFLGAQEEIHTISTACAAGLDAIGLAARAISNGRSRCIVAGGGDAPLDMTPLAEFSRAGLASTRNSHPSLASRPFDAFADSGVLSDAAGLVLLEEKNSALDRAGRILGEVVGYGSRCDSDSSHPGSGYAACMQEALDSAGLVPEDIDHISAWGPGHPVLDRNEASAIEKVFGDYAEDVPVSSIKGTLGNPLSGGGPAQVIAALKGLALGIIPHTTNLEIPIPNCRLNLIMRKPLRYEYEHVLINAHGIGGSNASLILRRCEN